MKLFFRSFGPVLILLSTVMVNAEVVDKAANGFHIKIEAEVNATREATYQQFLRIGQWWDGEHSWFGDASAFSIEPRAGGCFCEIKDGNSVMHMQVSFVKPGHEVRMLGGLGPLQMLGLHGAMSFSFESIKGRKTRIIHEYRVTGYAQGGLESLADVVNSAQAHQVKRLQNLLN